jgi:multidrug efflux pump subunit AcrA (membrane-fusion protein)
LEVPLQGQLSQNVVTYQVPVSLEGVEGVALKSGMTANLQIVVGQRENALLVPVLAVQQGDVGNVVMVEETPGGAGVQAPVEVGLSDGTYVEVVRGLNEGDRVVIEYQAAQETTGFGFGRLGGMGQGPVMIEGGASGGRPPQP